MNRNTKIKHVFFSTGAKWHSRRKLLTPAFHFKVLDKFLHSFNKHSSKLIDVLRNRTGKTFDVAPLIALSALDIICGCNNICFSNSYICNLHIMKI